MDPPMKRKPTNLAKQLDPIDIKARKTNSSFYSGDSPAGNGTAESTRSEKMAILARENELLKQELQKALRELEELRDENHKLKYTLKENGIKIRTSSNADESTFITKGASNPTAICENCDKEIQKDKMKLHVAYCMKNITKCSHCKNPIDVKDIQKHLDEKKGTIKDWVYTIMQGTID